MTALVLDRSSPIPLYHQLAQYLGREIRSGRYEANAQLPPVGRLVKMFGVSMPVVQQALGRLEEQRLIVRERGRGTFVRPGADWSTVEGHVVRHHRMGLVMGWESWSIFAPLPGGAEDECHTSGFQVAIGNSRDTVAIEIEKIRELVNRGIDALLWVCASSGPNPALVRRVVRDVPVVVAVDREVEIEGVRLNLVEPDNAGGMRAVVRHLLENGHRRIAYIREPFPVSSTWVREHAYAHALREAGIEPQPRWVLTSRESLYENGIACATRILEEKMELDAICCQSDRTAIGVLNVLQDAGVRVPQDVAITGFNDDPMARMVRPRLTTAHFDVSQMGRLAARLALTQLAALERGENVEPERVIVPVQLVVRESTGKDRNC